MTVGLLVVAVVLLAGTGIGVWRRRADGRLADAKPHGRGRLAAAERPEGPPADTKPHGGDRLVATEQPEGRLVAAEQLEGRLVAAESGLTPPAPGKPASAETALIEPELLAALGVGGSSATLLQFSSAFCAPCRAVRRISAEVAEMVPGVRHVEVDAESHLDVVRALDIWRTPTLLVLDADGCEIKRATGVPGKAQLIAVLGEIIKT